MMHCVLVHVWHQPFNCFLLNWIYFNWHFVWFLKLDDFGNKFKLIARCHVTCLTISWNFQMCIIIFRATITFSHMIQHFFQCLLVEWKKNSQCVWAHTFFNSYMFIIILWHTQCLLHIVTCLFTSITIFLHFHP